MYARGGFACSMDSSPASSKSLGLRHNISSVLVIHAVLHRESFCFNNSPAIGHSITRAVLEHACQCSPGEPNICTCQPFYPYLCQYASPNRGPRLPNPLAQDKLSFRTTGRQHARTFLHAWSVTQLGDWQNKRLSTSEAERVMANLLPSALATSKPATLCFVHTRHTHGLPQEIAMIG